MKDSFECYKILGLEPGASARRVRKAYLQLSHFYDPAGDLGTDPEHLASAKLKRQEVFEAYEHLRSFLPDLQGDGLRDQDLGLQDRDFKEFVHKRSTELSKTVVAFVLGTAAGLIFLWGYSVFKRAQDLPAAPVFVVDPEAAGGQAMTPVPSTAPSRAVPVE